MRLIRVAGGVYVCLCPGKLFQVQNGCFEVALV